MSDYEEDVPGLEDPDTVTKYKVAADIANSVIKKVQAAVKDGVTVLEICCLGDQEIEKGVASVYNKKVEGRAVEKGVAFPTCVSINNCVCHCSPLRSDEPIVIKDGDVCKVDLAVHIDGYIAPVATTFVVGASAEKPVDGRKADVIAAAHAAAEVALRLFKAGGSTKDVTQAMNDVAKDFDCVTIEGMLSHQIGKFVIDGEKAIISRHNENSKNNHRESEFAVNEAYALDVFASTGDGKAKLGDQRTSVYKKTETNYQLKMKASRNFVSEVIKKFTVMPFPLRACEDEKKARLGVTESVAHGVVQPFDLLWEAEGSYVAQFKLLVMILPNGTLRGTTVDYDAAAYKTEHSVSSNEYKKLLETTVTSKTKKKKNNNKNKKKDKDSGASAAETK